MKDKIKILFPLDQHEDPKTIWRKYYEDKIRDDLDTLRFMSEEIGTFQRIRETFSENARIKNLCEEILKELNEQFPSIREDIENARSEIRKLEQLSRPRRSDLIDGDGHISERAS